MAAKNDLLLPALDLEEIKALVMFYVRGKFANKTFSFIHREYKGISTDDLLDDLTRDMCNGAFTNPLYRRSDGTIIYLVPEYIDGQQWWHAFLLTKGEHGQAMLALFSLDKSPLKSAFTDKKICRRYLIGYNDLLPDEAGYWLVGNLVSIISDATDQYPGEVPDLRFTGLVKKYRDDLAQALTAYRDYIEVEINGYKYYLPHRRGRMGVWGYCELSDWVKSVAFVRNAIAIDEVFDFVYSPELNVIGLIIVSDASESDAATATHVMGHDGIFDHLHLRVSRKFLCGGRLARHVDNNENYYLGTSEWSGHHGDKWTDQARYGFITLLASLGLRHFHYHGVVRGRPSFVGGPDLELDQQAFVTSMEGMQEPINPMIRACLTSDVEAAFENSPEQHRAYRARYAAVLRTYNRPLTLTDLSLQMATAGLYAGELGEKYRIAIMVAQQLLRKRIYSVVENYGSVIGVVSRRHALNGDVLDEINQTLSIFAQLKSAAHIYISRYVVGDDEMLLKLSVNMLTWLTHIDIVSMFIDKGVRLVLVNIVIACIRLGYNATETTMRCIHLVDQLSFLGSDDISKGALTCIREFGLSSQTMSVENSIAPAVGARLDGMVARIESLTSPSETYHAVLNGDFYISAEMCEQYIP